MLQIVLKVLMGVTSDAGHSHLSVATSFQPGKDGLPCPQAALKKVLPACFFLNSIPFHHGEGGGGVEVRDELLAAQLPVHPFHPPESCMWFAALRVTDMVSNPDASVFSHGFMSLLQRKNLVSGNTPKLL